MKVTNEWFPVSSLAWQVVNGVFPEYRRTSRYIEGYLRLSTAEATRRDCESLYQYLRYCQKYSSYWRERWPVEARNFVPEEAPAVLSLLPPLRKADLREHQAGLRIRPEDREKGDGFPEIGRQQQVRSGGTTGQPVVVFQDDNNVHQMRATIDSCYRRCGLIPGKPFFYIWGSNNELSELSQSVRKRLSSRLRGIRPISAFALNHEKLSYIAEEMRRCSKIESAMFFASALETFISWVEVNDVKLRRLKRVLTGGGLLHDELRRKVKEYLADEVFDVYGTRDFGLIACEDKAHDGLRVASWLQYVEVLDSEGASLPSGMPGEIHVTAFWNFSFALIRAATGDTAEWHPPEGTRTPLPRLKHLRGRVAEHLRGPNNTVIDPSAIIHMIGVLIAPPWLRKFQLVQYSPATFELRVESWNGGLSAVEINELRNPVREGLSKLLSTPVSLEVVRLDAIPPAASGKHLYCVAELGKDNDSTAPLRALDPQVNSSASGSQRAV